MRSTTLPTHATLLDPASGAPLRAIGLRKDGRPVWPVLGAAEGDGSDGGDDKSGEGDGKPDGDTGKTFTQAELDRVVSDRLARERAKYGDIDSLKAAKAELDELKAQNASDLEKAVAAARKEGETAASTRANQRLVAAEARALAADANFHNPRDAAQLVNLSEIKVGEDGEVDSDAVKALIDKLATERPYLVKAAEGEKKNDRKRDPGQGARTGTGNGSLEAGQDAYAARKAKRGGTTKTT